MWVFPPRLDAPTKPPNYLISVHVPNCSINASPRQLAPTDDGSFQADSHSLTRYGALSPPGQGGVMTGERDERA